MSASARNPSCLSSNTNCSWSNGSGMRTKGIGCRDDRSVRPRGAALGSILSHLAGTWSTLRNVPRMGQDAEPQEILRLWVTPFSARVEPLRNTLPDRLAKAASRCWTVPMPSSRVTRRALSATSATRANSMPRTTLRISAASQAPRFQEPKHEKTPTTPSRTGSRSRD